MARGISEYFPASHDLHSDSLLMPGISLQKPAAHSVHFSAEEMPSISENVPAGQSWQLFSSVVPAPVASDMPCFPRGHKVHPNAVPLSGANRPCSHGVQSAWFRLAVNMPGSQSTHDEFFPSAVLTLCFPGSQPSHETDPMLRAVKHG